MFDIPFHIDEIDWSKKWTAFLMQLERYPAEAKL